MKCVCCQGPAAFFTCVSKDGVSYRYYECRACGSLFIEPAIVQRMDDGEQPFGYAESYWAEELGAARERAFGPALARMAEVIYYCRIPVQRFLDIGTGPGYFLDAVARYLPSKTAHFFGVEKFPPPPEHRTASPNYIVGELKNLTGRYQAGLCIEVIEHMTPAMLRHVFRDLARISEDESLFLFNTGLPPYVKNEDMGYLDPFVRGHIVSYSLSAIAHLSHEFGFTVIPLKGKTWAFLLEYRSKCSVEPESRIWQCLPGNRELLHDEQMGTVLQILAIDTARAY